MSKLIRMCSKGSLTLPVELRRKYGLNEGDIFTLIDLGDGAFMLTPNASMVVKLGDRAVDLLAEQNALVDEVLQALDKKL